MYIEPTDEIREILDWLERDELIQEGRLKIESKLETQYGRLCRLITVEEDAPEFDAPAIVVVRWANAVLRTAFRILHLRDSQKSLQKMYDDFYAGLPLDLTVLKAVLRLSDYDQ
jgi:hypothetical protein